MEVQRARALVGAASGRMATTEDDAKQVLACFGLVVPRRVVVPFGGAVGDRLHGLVPPYALKVVAPAILHKSDLGGVRLGLADAGAAQAAIDAMAARLEGHAIEGWLLEEMAPAGPEIVIGATVDPCFGENVMVGLGGVLVELFEDVCFGICPIRPHEARRMLDSLRGVRLLRGFRGAPVADEAAVVEALLRIGGAGGLMAELSDVVAELDVNPLIVSGRGAVAVDARIVLRPTPLMAGLVPATRAVERAPAWDTEDGMSGNETRSRSVTCVPGTSPGMAVSRGLAGTEFGALFEPRSIVVIGASTSAGGVANNFLRNLRTLGFAGTVWAVHPSADTIEGWPAFPSIAALPGPVDYAYVSVAAARTPALLREAGGRIRVAQVIASGFGEAGEAGLEAALVTACRAGGVRLVGPNCLGLYSSRSRVSFIGGVGMEPGGIAVLAQSGGLGADILRRGQMRGLRFATVLTLGNCADLGPAELLPPLLDDPGTQVIGLYLEDVKDGRGFFDALRDAGAKKPVVILKGGRTAAGQRASASHTGALAQDDRLWRALSMQTGAVLVDTLDQFIAALLVFQCLTPRPGRPTRNVVLFGNGGGTSVLATDAFSRAGFTVPALGGEALARLEAMRLPPGSSIGNPIDTPAGTLRQERGALAGRIVAAAALEPGVDAIVLHLNMPVILAYSDPEILPNLVRGALDAMAGGPAAPHFVLVLRSDGEPEIEAEKHRYRTAAIALGVPAFDELAEAAGALACLAWHERFLEPEHRST